MSSSGRRGDQPGAAAVVVAAGAGARLGSSRPKLFAEIGGRPLVFHSLSVLEACRAVDHVVLVVPPGFEGEVESEIVRPFSLGKICRIVPGGETRGDSVRAGLVHVFEGARIVLIHDGARPLVTEDLVLRVYEAAERFGAAVPGVMSADTLKRIEDGIAVATLDRSVIRRIQTPQGFHYPLIMEAYEGALKRGEVASDDAALVERMGTRVRIVKGLRTNLKITTPEDLVIAEALLAARG